MGVGNEDQTAFAFDGNWREIAPILFTNLLLTIVTLGFYRFWATTRERQYLWSRTRFIDDRLEWTGTGKELFLGFLVAMGVIILPLILINLILQGLILQDQTALAGFLIFGLYIFILYIVGIATFRALRYRLARTYWHGIRGGSDDPGLTYGWSWMWKNAVAYLAIGLMFPWAMASLWKERWSAMSFGPHHFTSNPEWGKLMPRYILCYLVPVVAMIALFAMMVPMLIAVGAGTEQPTDLAAGSIGVGIIFFILAFYIILPLAALAFYAAYLREVISTMRLGDLGFEFTARTKDWVKLFLGSVGLIIITLGIGSIFLGYRNWSFFIRHLEATGEVNLSSLTQSQTAELKQGEGLLDAFDLGAI
jgi:uncharacterized membrane protein YjgN (DUF898 family)